MQFLTNSTSLVSDKYHYYGNYETYQKAYNMVTVWRERQNQPRGGKNLEMPWKTVDTGF